MTTTQLTTTQHTLLAHAIEHTKGKIVWFPDTLKGGARRKVLDGLMNRALITTDGTHWSVTAEGYEAMGYVSIPFLDIAPVPQDAVTATETETAAEETPAPNTEPSEVAQGEAEEVQPPRKNSKQAQVIEMLKRPEGATVKQICEATEWQAHTVRGALSGTLKKKLGFAITSTKHDGERVYKIN
ncbi:MAG: DUF3489 domain-containing protein [Azovibrio sp.]